MLIKEEKEQNYELILPVESNELFRFRSVASEVTVKDEG
jgi:hypothetical protein